GSSSDVEIPVDMLLLHQGVVPNVNLAMSAGVEHRWDDTQLCFSPVVNASGATSVAGIYVAGDGAGIAGGQAAAWRGVLAACEILASRKPGVAKRTAAAARIALEQ